jgi:Uma2 family endonuclease
MANLTKTRMTAAEFAQLEETTQPTELIHGEVIVSPAPKDPHQDVTGTIYAWFLYVVKPAIPGGQPKIAPLDVYFDEENVLQPDVFWIHNLESKCRLGDDGYWHGAPDLIVEVLSPGTRKRDRKTKFELYERHGVREYWIVDPTEILVEVFTMVDGRYQLFGVYDIDETFTSPLLGLSVELKLILAK